MKTVNSRLNSNCIISQSSCTDWNGGDIEFLGICNGDPLNNVVIEIVDKLKELAGEDLSSFDIDSILSICNQKAPLEVTLLSILNALKNNDICLKDYIDKLGELVAQLSAEQNVSVNLKCYADVDNLGNQLSISRDQLDQLIIDNLCAHEERLDYVEGRITTLQSAIDIINNDDTINEQVIATCIDPLEKPVSSQVISVADALCDLQATVNTILTNLSALTTLVNEINDRVTFMEENCCAATCDDIELGFNAVYNEDGSGVIISFTWGAGTSIPNGFVDNGSQGTITDIDGNIASFNIDIVDNFTNTNETEVILTGMNLAGPLVIAITANIGNESLNCQKCLSKTITGTNCGVCTVCTTGSGTVTIIYESDTVALGSSVTTTTSIIVEDTTTTTTTSTTTTTTSV